MFSYLIATINGLSTIRSRKIQKKLCHEFDELQNVHNSVAQLSLSSTQSFTIWIDSIVLLFLASVTYSFVYFSHGKCQYSVSNMICQINMLIKWFHNSDSISGNVGFSITQALMLTGMVQYAMRRLTDAMQQMTSVERIIEYTELEPVS